jgi:hypothetical protein
MTDLLLQLAELIGPVVIAALVVPLYGYIKKIVVALDKLPALIQQVLVIFIAAILTWAGAQINVALPTDLALFTDADLAAGLAGALSLLIHNAKKTRELGDGG